MSTKHPIIAVTGSSGAGTTTVKVAFEHIFLREGVKPVIIEGDSYHRPRAGRYVQYAALVQTQNENYAGITAPVTICLSSRLTHRTR